MTQSQYLLPRDATESQRLNGQHRLMVEAFNNQLVHPSVKLPEKFTALDCGTGTAVYLKALGEQASGPYPSELVGCDYSETQFPSESERTVQLGNGSEVPLQVFQHDITQPLPIEHQGKYDFVHQRLLVAGIKKPLWPQVISNLCAGLKPGGWLQLVEFEMEIKADTKPPAGPFFEQTQTFVNNSFDLLGMNRRLVRENKAMAESSGLELCESVVVPYPVGAAAQKHGMSAEYGEAMLINTRNAILGFTRGAKKMSGKGPDEDELHKWSVSYEDIVRTHGYSIAIGVTIGRKPLE